MRRHANLAKVWVGREVGETNDFDAGQIKLANPMLADGNWRQNPRPDASLPYNLRHHLGRRTI